MSGVCFWEVVFLGAAAFWRLSGLGFQGGGLQGLKACCHLKPLGLLEGILAGGSAH